MKPQEKLATLQLYPQGSALLRYAALWYFAVLITVWTILGHTVLGFEQSWAQPVVAVLTCAAVQLALEWLDAWGTNRPPRFAGGPLALLNFLLTALIPGLAIGMLIYANELLMPMVFASVVAIASKPLLRAPLGNGQTQHVFNPSNLGITATLLLFPQVVGLAPPYQFTENIAGWLDWALPGLVLGTGIVVHGLFTGRLPLVLAWLAGFLVQALVRGWLFDIPLIVLLVPMTSAAFILFTLYMIPDPATTPLAPSRQALFGLAVAAVYALLQVSHVVFGLLIALVCVCALRGLGLYLLDWKRRWTGIAAAVAERG